MNNNNEFDEKSQIKIEIPEITRVEGHCAVSVNILHNKVENVELDVFEGTRYFEQIVINHKYDELPHITSRVCAICSTGHVLACITAIENIFKIKPNSLITDLRHLMHLGMIIESNATHICALALPDFFGIKDLAAYASSQPEVFKVWTQLRNLGTLIQTVVGGRPFHPINLHVGGFGKLPTLNEFYILKNDLENSIDTAINLVSLLLEFKDSTSTPTPVFIALKPYDNKYGYFGSQIVSSDGFSDTVANYHKYLKEDSVVYSHAKRSTYKGKPFMVGAMARLNLFNARLGSQSFDLYKDSPLAKNQTNSIYNNFAQSIEIVEAIFQSLEILDRLIGRANNLNNEIRIDYAVRAGLDIGAVECPRGTLYHEYDLDSNGVVLRADMITPSAQNSYRIETDIKENVEALINKVSQKDIEAKLETIVRAYDPCNTCATHMVSVKWG